MRNIVQNKINEARDKLDMNIKTSEERKKLVAKILDDIQDYLNVYLYGDISEKIYNESEQFTKDYFDEKKEIRFENRAFVNNFLEQLSNYIVYAKDEGTEEKNQRNFEERKVINKSLIAGGGDGLRPDGEAQAKKDKKVYFTEAGEPSFTGNYKTNKKQTITAKDVKNSSILQQYDEFRKILLNIKRNIHLNGKELYLLNKTLGGLRDDMIFIKDMENGTIYFKDVLLDSGSSKSSYLLTDDWDYEHRKYLDQDLICDFFNKDHYDTILKALPFKDLSDNLNKIYKRFEMLETYLELSDDKTKILDILKEGKSVKFEKLFYKADNRRELIKNNKEAVYDLKSLKEKLGWTYVKTRDLYYKLCEDCYNAFIEMYEEEFYYMYIVKGEYKKCSKCGKVKLVQRFNQKKDNKDGFEGYCKKCKQKNR